METNNRIVKAKTATQYIFLICGIAISSWAPMVPLAKERLGLNDGDLGLLLLLLGLGAIVMMPVSGYLSHRFGTRIVIIGAGLVAATMLPLLTIISNATMIAIVLFIFGAGIGTIDVAMNTHGIFVQNRYGKPIMSSLHGLFSVGGLCGSLGLGFLMKMGLSPLIAAVTISLVLVTVLFWKYPVLFRHAEESEQEVNHRHAEKNNQRRSRILNPTLLLLGLVCFIAFLSEGAMLDWSALFLIEYRKVDTTLGGIGYASFSIAMAVMRLLGDKLVSRFNGRTIVILGGLLSALGIFCAMFTPWLVTSLLGFILLGIGAANIVPVFFSEGGKIKSIPASVAIPVISTMGYAGQLVGPALLGFIAHHFSLLTALVTVGVLMLLVAAIYTLKKQPTEILSPDKKILDNAGVN